MLRRRRFWIISGIIVLMPIAWLAWWVVSPLFIDTIVQEEFPFASSAVTPDNMTRAEVEQIMAGLAKVDQEMSEKMPDTVISALKLKTGALRDADGFHKGSGQAAIYRLPDGSHVLRLEDLRVTNGPNLHVILTPHANPMARSDVKVQGYVDLGKLKGNIGNQNYEIPAKVDVATQMSVVIYCKTFHVIFTVAPLQDPV